VHLGFRFTAAVNTLPTSWMLRKHAWKTHIIPTLILHFVPRYALIHYILAVTRNMDATVLSSRLHVIVPRYKRSILSGSCAAGA